MNCPYCGASNEDGNIFCLMCGKPIPSGQTANLRNRKQPKTVLIFWALIIIGVIIMIIGGLFIWQNQLSNQHTLVIFDKSSTQTLASSTVQTISQ